VADTAALISPLPGLCPYHLIKATVLLPFLAATNQGGHWSLRQPLPIRRGRSRRRAGNTPQEGQ